MSEYNSASFLNDIDKEELCSSAESTPSQVRRRMTDVKLTKEKYVDKAKNTISAASRLLRRKIPQTGHLMTSKRFWMQTIPNHDVDVVITFPHDAKETTVLWFKQKIERIPGIILRTKSIIITSGSKTKPNCYAFHISASYKGYLQGLEQMQVPKPVKEELGGGLKEFALSEASNFKNIESIDEFLSSQERQSIIFHLLNGIRAEKGDAATEKLKFRDGEAILPKSLSKKVVLQIFPVHDQEALQLLQKTWIQKIWERQPIGDICDYFGVKIALYFAWLGHYTTALFIPTIVGIIFWVFFCGKDEFLEDIGFVMFAFFNVIWATLYLESWKRRSAELAFEWGTSDQRPELLSEPRPLYKGDERISEITGKPTLHSPDWKRYVFRYFVTIPVISICLLVVLVTVVLILELQQWWDGVIKEKGYFSFLSFLPKVLLAIIIPILDNIYNEIALWLNDMENYRNAASYESNMVIKMALFQFVNSFMSLFYTAFVLQDMDKLKELLAALLITRQVVGNIKESIIPYAKKHFKLAQLSFDKYGALSPTDNKPNDKISGSNGSLENEGAIEKKNCENAENSSENNSVSPRKFSQVECESSAPKYDGTFEDYLEMFIQFGYVILFSSAYPLAGLCALINNIIEIRGDAFKLCHVHQRPFGQRVNNIGSWQTAMELMGIVGIIVNCALIGQSGQVHRMFPNITSTQTIILVVILEHVMILLKVAIAYAIPDVPVWVETEMAKIEYRRRETEKNLSSAQSIIRQASMASPSVSINDSVENEDNSICDEKKDTSNVAGKDLRKLSPQQEAIRTYLNSRNINVTQEEDVSGSDSSFEDIIELNSVNNSCLIDTPLPQGRHISKEYSNINMMQHPTIAEELEAVSYQNDIEECRIADVDQSESNISLSSKKTGRYNENIKQSEIGGLSTIIEHQATTLNEDMNSANGLSDIHPMKESSRSRSASVGQRSPNMAPYSPILERSESLSSQEIMDDNIICSNKNGHKNQESGKISRKPVDRRDLYKRMASDTDLWMSIKSRPSKFQSNLEATKETSDSQLTKPSWSNSGGIIINHIDMPIPEQMERNSSTSNSTKSIGPQAPTPPNKRVLDQEEFDRRLKAKRGTFSKKRSLSLASFKFTTPRKVKLPMEKIGSKLNLMNIGSEKSEKVPKKPKEDKDLKYLEKFKARGELDLLNLDSLIDVNDFSV